MDGVILASRKIKLDLKKLVDDYDRQELIGVTMPEINKINRLKKKDQKKKKYIDLFGQTFLDYYFPESSEWPSNVKESFKLFIAAYFKKLTFGRNKLSTICIYSQSSWKCHKETNIIEPMSVSSIESHPEENFCPSSSASDSSFNTSSSNDSDTGEFLFKRPLPPQKTRQELKNEIKILNTKLNQYEELMEARNNEIAELKKQIKQLKIENNKKRSHVSDGATPHPTRKRNMISLFRDAVGSSTNLKINLRTRIFIMKSLRRGCSYRQIVGVLEDMKVIIPNDLLQIGAPPCMSSIHKIFVEFALLVKTQITMIFENNSRYGHSTDETPDLDGCPILASCMQDLKSGKKIIIGLSRMGGKTAEDMRRVEEQTLKVLHYMTNNVNEFDFVGSFLSKISVRGGDNSATERKYHKNLNDEAFRSSVIGEIQPNIPRISCQLHLDSNLLRHMEKDLADVSIVFPVIKLITKHLGQRSAKIERLEFTNFMKTVKEKKVLKLVSQTGVRFIEQAKYSDNLLEMFPDILDFVDTLDAARQMRLELTNLTKTKHLGEFYVDLQIIICVNASIIEPAFRAAINPQVTLCEYKKLMMKLLDLCNLETVEFLENILLMKNVPFLSKYFKPTNLQSKAMSIISCGWNEIEKSRGIFILEKCKNIISNDLRNTNAVLLDLDLPEEISNVGGLLNNNAIESSFGILDYMSRHHINLSFIFRECVVLATKNEFFKWFDDKEDTEKIFLLKKVKKQRDAVLKLMQDQKNVEESIRCDRLGTGRIVFVHKLILI